jgi:hypothetical protein
MASVFEFLQPVPETRKPATAIPDGSKILKLNSSEGDVWMIWAAAGTPATDFAAAPNGSIMIQLEAAGAGNDLWIKMGASFGATDGTWKYITVTG